MVHLGTKRRSVCLEHGNGKDECKKQGCNPHLPPLHCSFLHLYQLVNHKGAPKTQYLICGLCAIPKVFPFFLGVVQNHPEQLPSLSHMPLPTEQQRGNKRISFELLPTHNRCHVSHTPSWVRNQNSCLDTWGSTMQSSSHQNDVLLWILHQKG